MPSMPRLLVAALIALAFSACQKQDTPTPVAEPSPPVTEPAPAPTEPAPAPEAVPAEATAPAASAVGIAECDDFLTKYEACVADKVPAEVQASLRASMDATRAAWVQAAAQPGGADSLAAACKSMHEQSRASMQAYGCTDF